MASVHRQRVRALLVAVPETAGSALYGMVDVLSAAGTLWHELTGGQGQRLFSVEIIATERTAFACGNGIPVTPAHAIADDPPADLIIIPEIWLGPNESLAGRHPRLVRWIRDKHRAGATLYSACSGAILLAETGLLDNCEATSHWGYRDLFRTQYPRVRFRPEPSLAFADPAGRIVTAGGTTSWHDLALHIIARHGSPAEALHIARVYLLKWHAEGQLPYTALVRRIPHGDAVVRRCEDWLQNHYQDGDAVSAMFAQSGIPERTLKRRFLAATGCSVTDRLQDIRIERAKRLLEQSGLPVEQIASDVGYSDTSFFRRLFRRRVGLTPGNYRRMFSLPVPDTERQPESA